MNQNLILRIVGVILCIEALCMIPPLLLSVFDGGVDQRAFLYALLICGGGVGCGDDIVDAAQAGADAVACAAVLHYQKETVQELKDDIRAGGVEVRRV